MGDPAGDSARIFMPLVVWSEAAIQDIKRHFDFLNPLNPDAAARAVRAILDTGNVLRVSPYRGTVIDSPTGLRRMVAFFGKYGFVIHYQIDEGSNRVIIARVYHGREDRPH